MKGNDRKDYLWLGAILVLATALRIKGLNSALWHDEIQTLLTHVDLGWGEMVRSYSMNHHYLHNFAVKVSVSLFGDAPWAVRLPAMLFGLGAIAAMWALARRIAGSGPAHVTALLLALSYHEIWFSQNARGYTGLALFSTLGMSLFLSGLAAPRLKTWLLYALCLAAAVFTHLTGAFFFMAQGLVWLAVIAARARRGELSPGIIRYPFIGFLVGGLICIALYLPIVPSLMHTVSTVSDTSAIDPMKEYQNPLWTALEAIRTGLGQGGALVKLVGLAVLVLSGLGAWALRRTAPLFAIVTAAHILLTVALLMAVGMRIWPRFFFADISFLMLLIVLGVRLCCQIVGGWFGGERPARAFYMLAVVAMVLVSALLAKRNYLYPKQDLAGAVAFVEGMRTSGARVYALGYAGENFRYYKEDWQVVYSDAAYEAAMATPGPLILVVGFPERVFRDIPTFARDARGESKGDICAPRPADTAVLTMLKCFPGTLGDGTVMVLSRD